MTKFDVWTWCTTRALLGGALALTLVACGGGGGNAGTPVLPSGGASSPSGGAATAAYLMAVQVQRSGAAVTQISSVETVQAVATVTTQSGAAVPGVVVTFTEGSVGLLAFQPRAATALTGADGKASVDLAAKTTTDIGATTVTAASTVASVALTASQSIAIAAGSVTTTTPIPATIAFVSSSAGGQAIAIKGAGGSGRAEAAILTFKVLDATGAPINGATVNFSINAGSAVGATLSPASAVSDSSGRVTTTVLSGTEPGSIIVVATAAAAPGVKVQSDTLLVSNSVPIAAGFEIVAAKYNLDGDFTGDGTSVTAYVRDRFGNPVADGLAVSFQTDYGAVATSTLGGCTTVNGICSVAFRVQEPRGTTGLATVVATIGVGTANVFQQSLQIHMAAGAYSILRETGTALLTSVSMTSGKQTVQGRLQDAYGRAAAAGTEINVQLATSDLTVAIKAGSPVLDQLSAGFAPTLFGFEIDATKLAPLCKAPATGQGYVNIGWKTPHGQTSSQRIDITYPCTGT